MPPQPPGASGKGIVGVLLIGLVGALGVGQVYLPYLSPQSEVRRDGNGMGKEMREDERRRKEKFLKDVKAKRGKEGLQQPGGMWKNINKAAKRGGEGGEHLRGGLSKERKTS